jgi:hypothetical protein
MLRRRVPVTFEVGLTVLIHASSVEEVRAQLDCLLPSSLIVEAKEVQYCEEHVAAYVLN